MISAVFDATILLQAAANRKGPAGSCLSFVDQGHVKLFLSALTLEEIGEVLNITENNAKVRLYRALDKIKKIISNK